MTPRTLFASCATALVAVVLTCAGPAVASGPSPDPAQATAPGVYVVMLAAEPSSVHVPTTPGARFDRTRPEVRAYEHQLVDRQDQVVHSVGDPAVLYHYATALDGFAASLTTEQVQRLRRTPGVVRVERSTKHQVDQVRSAPVVGSSSRDLLGLAGPTGVWAQHGGPAKAGKGVVVGVVDTGIWPENPSFNGLPQHSPGTVPGLPGFHGDCAAAQQWTAQSCNDKVVSAQWFVNGFGEENVASAEYLSPRDGTGHGSHVASTIAGDHGVRVVVDGQGFGSTAGMAPAARLAVYKACWTAPDPSQDGCTTADTVAAVDQAVGDGVDVLNYSISGSDQIDDAVATAFLGAASAGVFVAASGGNTAGSGTVQHVEPWVTSVAASTHHVFQGAVRLGGGRELVGAMVSDQPVRTTRLVSGRDVRAPGASASSARHCLPGSLDAARAQGAIVVCERGGGARVDKSSAVAAAGGTGMVLLNSRHQSTDADVHAVPTVHLDVAESHVVLRYLAQHGAHATASLDPEAQTSAQVPQLAGFSSHGPVAGRDVVKPDLTAPGVSVLGAVAPPSDSGRMWDLASGTSSSAAHVSGLAAFVVGVHPAWSPSRVKSAMMTTATDLHGWHRPLAEGAGQVAPRRFLDPGLVFDTDARDWRRVAAGVEKSRDVNSPSLAIDALVGHATVTRTVTNVSSHRESYAVRVHGLHDVDVQAFPATLVLRPGQSRTVRLRVTARPTAAVDRDVDGWLVWHGDRHTVRIPVAVRPTVVAAPAQVGGRGPNGSVVVRGRSGNGRTVKLQSTGLVAARTQPVTVAPASLDPREAKAAAPSASTVVVPSGTDVARFEVGGVSPDPGVDLYVYRDGSLVGSATGTATGAGGPARVTLADPTPGSYDVVVAARSPFAADTQTVLATWVVPRRHTGAPVALSTDAVGSAPGRKFHYSAHWSGLDPHKRWLAVVSYGDTDRRTLVEVN